MGFTSDQQNFSTCRVQGGCGAGVARKQHTHTHTILWGNMATAYLLINTNEVQHGDGSNYQVICLLPPNPFPQPTCWSEPWSDRILGPMRTLASTWSPCHQDVKASWQPPPGHGADWLHTPRPPYGPPQNGEDVHAGLASPKESLPMPKLPSCDNKSSPSLYKLKTKSKRREGGQSGSHKSQGQGSVWAHFK